jgi:uncharacterized Fe-S cluster-containing radical SAM superfamily protein
MSDAVVTRDFVHPELGREVTAIGGHYVFGKEIRMAYRNREILYYVGYAVLDSTCCGVGGCAYVFVPGFVQNWKYKRNEHDADVSKIAPVRDHFVQKEIRSRIQKKEMVFQVTFD